MFSISIALASPLLAITGDQSFGFCLYGRTRSGKTIATLVGSSVIGIGRTDNLISWNITDPHLEERLSEFNDLVFPIDDLSTMQGRPKEKYLRIRDIAYRVSQGWARGRHSSWKDESGQQGWRCVMLTSSEKSIRDMAADAKIERQHGEALRLIDVPAVLDGSEHIFDRLSSCVPRPDFDAWRDKTFAGLVEDCAINHGVTLSEYLDQIISADFDIREAVQSGAALFVERVTDTGDDVVARDVAGKFGLVYAGGMLGIRLGVVSWNPDELLDAIAKCYRGARDLLPDEGVALRQSLARLEALTLTLVRPKSLSQEQIASKDWDKVDGYWMRRSEQDHYIIKCEIFNALFDTTAQRDLLLNWLIDNNRITMALVKTAGAGVSRNPKEQIIWPDGKRRRSYEIVFPRT
jgi:hypothetical protein